MDKCSKTAALYIATLKAMYLIHQHNHWTTKGLSFYGDHLMFQRLYESVQTDLDSAAEKFIGLLGDECIRYDLQTDLLNKVLLRFKSLEGSPAHLSLSIEKEFLKFAQTAYNCFEEEGKLTMGLDDMLMSVSSNRETAVYLLNQKMKDDK